MLLSTSKTTENVVFRCYADSHTDPPDESLQAVATTVSSRCRQQNVESCIWLLLVTRKFEPNLKAKAISVG
jgi:hypothetical protein